MNEQDKEAFEKWFYSSVLVNPLDSHTKAWQAALKYERAKSICPQCASPNKKRVMEGDLLFDKCRDCGETWSDPYTTAVNFLNMERAKCKGVEKELESTKIAYQSNQKAAVMSAMLSDRNRELEKKLEIAVSALHRIVHDFECVPVSVANEALSKIGGNVADNNQLTDTK